MGGRSPWRGRRPQLATECSFSEHLGQTYSVHHKLSVGGRGLGLVTRGDPLLRPRVSRERGGGHAGAPERLPADWRRWPPMRRGPSLRASGRPRSRSRLWGLLEPASPGAGAVYTSGARSVKSALVGSLPPPAVGPRPEAVYPFGRRRRRRRPRKTPHIPHMPS